MSTSRCAAVWVAVLIVLWNVAPVDCEEALDYLCESGSLVRDPSGRYLLPRFDD